MEKKSTEVKKTAEETRFRRAVADTGRGGGIGFAALLLGKGTSTGLQVVLARFLGPAGYGLFALGRAIMNVSKTLAKLGTDIGVVRFVSKEVTASNTREAAAVFRTALVLSVVGSIGASGILFLGAPFLNRFFEEPGFVPVLRCFAFALPGYTLMIVTTSLLQARKHIADQQGIRRLLNPVLSTILIGGVLLAGWELQGAVLAFAVSGILSLLIALGVVKIRFPELLQLSVLEFRIRRLLRYSLPVFLSALGSIIALRIDRILLGSMSTAEAVGVYNAAAIIGFNINIAKKAVMPVIKPVLSEVYAGDTQRRGDGSTFARTYRMAARWTYGLTFLVVLPVLIFPGLVMGLFGEGYAEGIPVLLVFLAFGLTGTVCGPTGASLKMAGHQDAELVNSIVLVTSIVLLDVILIPQFGALGAALGTLLATGLVEAIRVLEIYRYHRFQPFNRTYRGLVFATGVMAVAMYYLSTAQPIIVRLMILGGSVLGVLGVYYLFAEDEDRDAFRSLVAWFKAEVGLERLRARNQ